MLPPAVSKFVLSIRRSAKTAASLPQVPDPSPKRHQQTEIPPGRAVHQNGRHAVTCPLRAKATRAAYDEDKIPCIAVRSAIDGHHGVGHRRLPPEPPQGGGAVVRYPRRPVFLEPWSASVEACVSDAVQPAVDAAWERVRRSRGQTHRRHELVSSRVYFLRDDGEVPSFTIGVQSSTIAVQIVAEMTPSRSEMTSPRRLVIASTTSAAIASRRQSAIASGDQRTSRRSLGVGRRREMSAAGGLGGRRCRLRTGRRRPSKRGGRRAEQPRDRRTSPRSRWLGRRRLSSPRGEPPSRPGRHGSFRGEDVIGEENRKQGRKGGGRKHGGKDMKRPGRGTRRRGGRIGARDRASSDVVPGPGPRAQGSESHSARNPIGFTPLFRCETRREE